MPAQWTARRPSACRGPKSVPFFRRARTAWTRLPKEARGTSSTGRSGERRSARPADGRRCAARRPLQRPLSARPHARAPRPRGVGAVDGVPPARRRMRLRADDPGHGRLRQRASDLMLLDTFARLRDCAARGSAPPPPADKPYVSYHFSLVRTWPTELAHISSGRASLAALACFIPVCAVITAASSSCVPFWILDLAVLFLLVFTQEMLSVAAANAENDRIAALYRSHRTSFLVAAGRRGVPDAVRRALEDHAGMLAAFEPAEEVRGAWLGFRVSYAVVRGMLVTVVTVAVALWSLLRGAGVGFTPETVCPG